VSFGFSLSTDRDVGRGKAVYIGISSDPAKAGLTLEGDDVIIITNTNS